MKNWWNGFKYIWLVRNDIVAQASSMAWAQASGIYNAEKQFPERHTKFLRHPGVPSIESGVIAYRKICDQRHQLKELMGDTPHFRLTYEELVEDPQAALDMVMQYLGAKKKYKAEVPTIKMDREDKRMYLEALREKIRDIGS
jgi:Uncharacterized protein conserved in bacteria